MASTSAFYKVHPDNPQRRSIDAVAACVRAGGVIAYPTDSCYALGCHIGDKAAMDRIRRIRRVDERHHLTLMCRNLADVGQSSTLVLPDHGVALNDAEEIRLHLSHALDAIVDAGPCGIDVTTVVDLSGESPVLLREGKGDPRPFGTVRGAMH